MVNKLEKKTIKLEGFGNVGYHLIEYLNNMNKNTDKLYIVNTLSDHTGCYKINHINDNKNTVIKNIKSLLDYQNDNNSLES